MSACSDSPWSVFHQLGTKESETTRQILEQKRPGERVVWCGLREELLPVLLCRHQSTPVKSSQSFIIHPRCPPSAACLPAAVLPLTSCSLQAPIRGARARPAGCKETGHPPRAHPTTYITQLTGRHTVQAAFNVATRAALHGYLAGPLSPFRPLYSDFPSRLNGVPPIFPYIL